MHPGLQRRQDPSAARSSGEQMSRRSLPAGRPSPNDCISTPVESAALHPAQDGRSCSLTDVMLGMK